VKAEVETLLRFRQYKPKAATNDTNSHSRNEKALSQSSPITCDFVSSPGRPPANVLASISRESAFELPIYLPPRMRFPGRLAPECCSAKRCALGRRQNRTPLVAPFSFRSIRAIRGKVFSHCLNRSERLMSHVAALAVSKRGLRRVFRVLEPGI